MPHRLSLSVFMVLSVACTQPAPPALPAHRRPNTTPAQVQRAVASALPSPAPLAARRAAPEPEQAGQPRELLTLPWGEAPGQVGHRRGEEGMPEGPMALAVASDGRVAVLDQVNSRVQVLRPGQAPEVFALPRPTFQDVAWSADGRLLVLDRLGVPEVLALTGTPLHLALTGAELSEGAAATGLFPGANGIWVEIEHRSLVRLSDAEDQVPAQQNQVHGRFSADGKMLLSVARVAPNAVALTARLASDVPAFRRVLDFPLQILGVREVGGLADGRLVVVVHQGQEQGDTTVAQRLTALVLAANGTELKRIELPPPTQPEDQFRPVRLGDDGALYVLDCRKFGATIVKVVP